MTVHVHVVEIIICNLFEDMFIVQIFPIKDCYYGLRLKLSIKKVILKFCLCLLYFIDIYQYQLRVRVYKRK